jgi:hypothetical protein
MSRDDTISAEYGRICKLLRLREVTIDIYQYEEDAPPSQKTPSGTSRCNSQSGYRTDRKVIALPQTDDGPIELPEFPPGDWHKLSWPIWRIELWHEVIHQLSDHLGVLDRKEPGRVRDDGSRSTEGHGKGWWMAIQYAAECLAVSPDTLDHLLDR